MSKFKPELTQDGWRIKGKRGYVADVYGDHAIEKAALFAASPELLSAIKDCANAIKQSFYDYPDEADPELKKLLKKTMEAIAKAEGK